MLEGGGNRRRWDKGHRLPVATAAEDARAGYQGLWRRVGTSQTSRCFASVEAATAGSRRSSAVERSHPRRYGAREAVQRYFFHTDGRGAFRDQEGTLLPNDESARVEAARVLGQLVNERPAGVWQDDEFRIVVTDETGLILFTLGVAAVVAPAASPVRPKPSGRDES